MLAFKTDLGVMVGNGATADRLRDNSLSLPPWLRDVTEVDCREKPEISEARPSRYRVKRHADGQVLTCVEAPTVKVYIRRGVSVTATAARSATPGSIFLDGAAHGEPFLDPKREVYNLDHHEGCVRAFTLATCEQAMVLLRKGLDLRKRDWTVYANDPDLDTVLAIWVLLNHIRLKESSEARQRAMPLVRLQGITDAQGLELQELCGFPPALLAEIRGWMGTLRQQEIDIKARRRWRELDLLEYTAGVLHAIDALVYLPAQLERLEEVEELTRVEIANGAIAIVCRSRAGIYEVERQLRRLHGRRLGVVALQTDASTYSLRQVDPYLPATLEDVYAHLNLVDSAVAGPRSANRWGGSAEIGGSPRASGTRVSPEQIARACQQAFATPTLVRRLLRLGDAVARNTGLLLASLGWAFVLPLIAERVGTSGRLSLPAAGVFAALLTVFAGGILAWRGSRIRGLYGCRRPTGIGWLGLLPVAIAGALAGGVWIPAGPLPSAAVPVLDWKWLTAALLLPAGAEFAFRGLLLGSVVTALPMRGWGTRLGFSWPAFLSATLYWIWGMLLAHPALALIQPPVSSAEIPVAAAQLGPVVFGIAAGMARERSGSIAAALLFHWLCIAAVLAASVWAV